MPLYGRGFTLSDPDDNGLYAPAPQPIDAGPYTGTPGFWGYNEVRAPIDLTLIILYFVFIQMLQILEKFNRQDGWTIVRDPVYMVPYAYRGRQWIGYDDEQSIALKVLAN
jgi:chitinase